MKEINSIYEIDREDSKKIWVINKKHEDLGIHWLIEEVGEGKSID